MVQEQEREEQTQGEEQAGAGAIARAGARVRAGTRSSNSESRDESTIATKRVSIGGPLNAREKRLPSLYSAAISYTNLQA